MANTNGMADTLTQEFFSGGLAFLAAMALLSTILIAWQVRGPHHLRRSHLGETTQLILVLLLSGTFAYVLTRQPLFVAITGGLAVIATAAIKASLPRLTMAGALEMAVAPVAFFAAAPWSYLFLRDSGFPMWSLNLWVALIAVGLITFGFSFASKLATQALLTHRQWRRPIRPLQQYQAARLPKVSLHVPCYSEPPELVKATLDRIAKLDYPEYEVIVCDNNTEDPALWRPIAAHCARLNRSLGCDRFRFFHVSPLDGAKAGALNFCLKHTAADAELVAVLDADYVSRRHFLSRLVGFFDDPAIGYVQTSHDYRDYGTSRYLRMCYWEYLPYYKVDMASIQEYNAPFTIGTMCLFRKDVLEKAGGWAEWCLTEDSEVSIRLRACGYQGVYLRSTFGRGLIPEVFEDYKMQRFRWTAGPVQQLRRYWRLFLPRVLGGSRALNGWSKLLEFQRSFECMMLGPALLLGLVGVAAFLTLTASGHFPRIVLPNFIWYLIPISVAASLITKWKWYRLAGCTRIGDMIGGEIARMSLTYVKMIAGVAGLSRKPIKWRRTPKFKAAPLAFRAFLSALPEACLGLAFMLTSMIIFASRDQFGLHVGILMTIGAFAGSMTFWSAAAMAILSEHDLATRENVGPKPGTAILPSYSANEADRIDVSPGGRS
jgi:cellulose synthase/poly-beta-1,6-N-acetylglucosamine synthase-like glycosyltransferase